MPSRWQFFRHARCIWVEKFRNLVRLLKGRLQPRCNILLRSNRTASVQKYPPAEIPSSSLLPHKIRWWPTHLWKPVWHFVERPNFLTECCRNFSKQKCWGWHHIWCELYEWWWYHDVANAYVFDLSDLCYPHSTFQHQESPIELIFKCYTHIKRSVKSSINILPVVDQSRHQVSAKSESTSREKLVHCRTMLSNILIFLHSFQYVLP